MKKDKVKQIIEHGTIKQQINLIFLDSAKANVSDEIDDAILTEEERSQLYELIKDSKKEIKYYENLREANRGFLIYKPMLTEYTHYLVLYNYELQRYTSDKTALECHELIINSLFDLLSNENKSKALGLFPDSTLYKLNNTKTYISLQHDIQLEHFVKVVYDIEIKAKEFKELAQTFKSYLKTYLPLKPYQDSIKKTEKMMSKFLNDMIKASDELELPNGIHITPYDEIIVEIRQDDIEEIRKAGN